jgi:hypothetical protein
MAKFDKCVGKVKKAAKRGKRPVNAYAVCTAAGTKGNPSRLAIGQRSDVVKRNPMNLNDKLAHALTEYDRKEEEKARKSKHGYHNIYALGHYMNALHDVDADIASGTPVRQALLKAYTGRLLDKVLKAAGEPKSTNEEQRSGRWTRNPVEHNEKQQRNPEPAAQSMYESFHGSSPTEYIDFKETEHYHSNLSELGLLCGILVEFDGYLTPICFNGYTYDWKEEAFVAGKGTAGKINGWLDRLKRIGHKTTVSHVGSGSRMVIQTNYKGQPIMKAAKDDYRVPGVDRESRFDSLKDAKKFVDAWARNRRNPDYAAPFRMKAAEQRARIQHLIGKEETTEDGQRFILNDVNDLGVLYWVKPGGKTHYTVGHPAYSVDDILPKHNPLYPTSITSTLPPPAYCPVNPLKHGKALPGSSTNARKPSAGSVLYSVTGSKRGIKEMKRNPKAKRGPIGAAFDTVHKAGTYLDSQMGRMFNPDAKDDPEYLRLYKSAHQADAAFSKGLERAFGKGAQDVRYQVYGYPNWLKDLRMAKIAADNALRARLHEIRRRNPADPVSSTTVLLCSNEKGTHLYITGGDQSLDLSSLKLSAHERDHDSVVLGEAVEITYHTAKIFDSKQEEFDYFHEFSEDDGGQRPVVRYDTMNKKLFLDGGSYHIEQPMIGTSPGIEN